MNAKIIEWADKYVPEFNRLAQLHSAAFYTQSPLYEIDEGTDTVILGINPKGTPKVDDPTETSSAAFLNGNKTWANRVTDKNWIANNFYTGARWFMGYDKRRGSDAFDLDSKTVWTNLVPFQSDNGFNDLHPDLIDIGLRSTLDLIEILRPKRIVLLSKDGFRKLSSPEVADDMQSKIKYVRVLTEPALEIGTIFGIPAVCVPHPSGKWPVSNKFIPVFIFLHNLSYKDTNGNPRKSLEEVRDIMRGEISAWLNGLKL